MKQRHQSGNVLFIILIAIFLMGALTVLIVRLGGTSEETGDTERASIEGSEIMRYTAGMSQTVQKLLLSGCSENDISFWSDKWATPLNYDNLNNPEGQPETNYDCFVFDQRGGGYPWKLAPNGEEYVINGSVTLFGFGDDGRSELVIMALHPTETECRAMNRALGVQSFAKDGAETEEYFNGSYHWPWSALADDNDYPEYVHGKKAFCMQSIACCGLNDGDYFFLQMMIAR